MRYSALSGNDYVRSLGIIQFYNNMSELFMERSKYESEILEAFSLGEDCFIQRRERRDKIAAITIFTPKTDVYSDNPENSLQKLKSIFSEATSLELDEKMKNEGQTLAIISHLKANF